MHRSPGRFLHACLTALLLTGSLVAQTPQPGAEEKIAALEKAVANAQSAGDNAWMLTSAALVLMMTGPGLALFYGGLVRRKNVLGTMMHSFIMMAAVTVVWALAGYSIAFGEGNAYFGGLQYVLLNGVGAAPNAAYAGTIPHTTFMVYQLMFAIITPALISGAFAERVKFTGSMLFMTLWLVVVYLPMAHMVWGAGGLLGAVSGRIPAFDFAGGTVVHITSGVSALVAAMYLGRRRGFGSEAMRPHSVVLSTVGACLLWVGWFGFNAGSALNASGLATSAFVATHFSAAAAALTWMLAEKIVVGKPGMLGGISGAVAGLVAITPASGFVKPLPALFIGAVAGVFCFLMVSKIKAMFGYDDALDAFGVHGMGGTLGAILTGVFATKEVNDLRAGGAMGLVDGNGGQVTNQLIATVIAWVVAIVGTLLVLKVVDMTVGLRTTDQEEIAGLDLSMHGEEGYNLEG
ncbi:MAG: ammonium transporter [Bryobacterales bacterium]|nr:ammonium transporter [Bryobacterales bacterium]